MHHRLTRNAVAAAAVAVASPAFAHSGLGATHSAFDGLAHPFGGADHLLAMVAVGLIAGTIGRRGLALPLAFMAGMTGGALAGFAGLALPGVEALIIGSVVLFGLLLAFGRGLGLPALAAVTALAGLAHGWAHGAEAPLAADGLGYVAGFLAATAVLHGAGYLAVRRLSPAVSAWALKVVGVGLAVAGVAMAASL